MTRAEYIKMRQFFGLLRNVHFLATDALQSGTINSRFPHTRTLLIRLTECLRLSDDARNEFFCRCSNCPLSINSELCKEFCGRKENNE